MFYFNTPKRYDDHPSHFDMDPPGGGGGGAHSLLSKSIEGSKNENVMWNLMFALSDHCLSTCILISM